MSISVSPTSVTSMEFLPQVGSACASSLSAQKPSTLLKRRPRLCEISSSVSLPRLTSPLPSRHHHSPHLPQANRQLLAVGDDQGTVHVLEVLRSCLTQRTAAVKGTSLCALHSVRTLRALVCAFCTSVRRLQVPRNLRRAANNEKQFAANFFMREEKRVEYLQRGTDGEEGGEGGGEKSDAPMVEAKEGEPTQEEKLEAEFLALEEKFMEEMGLNPPDPAPAAEE